MLLLVSRVSTCSFVRAQLARSRRCFASIMDQNEKRGSDQTREKKEDEEEQEEQEDAVDDSELRAAFASSFQIDNAIRRKFAARGGGGGAAAMSHFGRNYECRRLTSFLNDDDPSILMLYGPPSCGKTRFLEKALLMQAPSHAYDVFRVDLRPNASNVELANSLLHRFGRLLSPETMISIHGSLPESALKTAAKVTANVVATIGAAALGAAGAILPTAATSGLASSLSGGGSSDHNSSSGSGGGGGGGGSSSGLPHSLHGDGARHSSNPFDRVPEQHVNNFIFCALSSICASMTMLRRSGSPAGARRRAVLWFDEFDRLYPLLDLADEETVNGFWRFAEYVSKQRQLAHVILTSSNSRMLTHPRVQTRLRRHGFTRALGHLSEREARAFYDVCVQHWKEQRGPDNTDFTDVVIPFEMLYEHVGGNMRLIRKHFCDLSSLSLYSLTDDLREHRAAKLKVLQMLCQDPSQPFVLESALTEARMREAAFELVDAQLLFYRLGGAWAVDIPAASTLNKPHFVPMDQVALLSIREYLSNVVNHAEHHEK